MPTPTTKDLTLPTPSDLAADFDTDLTTGLTTRRSLPNRRQARLAPTNSLLPKSPVYGGKSGTTLATLPR